MALYVHKKLQVLVTESNYTEFGIPNLDDPDMYRVVDVPEDIDFLENNVVFGEPTWDEENKTVYLYPTVSPIDDAYKQQLMKTFTDQCFQDTVNKCFTEAWQYFTFLSPDETKTYRFAIDIDSHLQWYRNNNGTWKAGIIPVYICDAQNPQTVLANDMVEFTACQMAGLYKLYSDYRIRIAQSGRDKYNADKTLSYEQVVQIIKKNNSEQGIIPDDIADVITFTNEKNKVKRTIHKRS